VASASEAYAFIADSLIRTADMASWRIVPTPAGARSPTVALERPLDPPRLFLAGSDGVWTSRDRGATWRDASAGVPRHPQANHIEVVEHPGGGRIAHLGTWNWSLFRARLD
jgi:hypothetical protein